MTLEIDLEKTLMYKLLTTLLICSFSIQAKSDGSWSEKPAINFSGFVDAFYVFDSNEPEDNERQPYLFNHNRHNEINSNLALFQIEVDHERYRATIGLQAGTYPQDNYSGEASDYKFLNEASVGISLNEENNLWLDVGLFPSNLGFESAISTDNMTLTRSLAAESSPYFLTGAKLNYSPTAKLELTALITTGWQRVAQLEGNSLPAFGTQVNYQLNDRINLNWSTFIGSEYPDKQRRMRYFNNFYGIFELSKKINLIAGIDIGAEQISKGSEQYDSWYVPTLITQYKWNEKWSSAFRLELIEDRSEIVLPQVAENGTGLWGTSLNIDYSPFKNIVYRMEARYFGNTDEDFKTISSSTYTSFFVASSLAIKF